MSWPPDTLWSKIAAIWRHAHGTPGVGEQPNALQALKQIQTDFDLSGVEVAYIAEHTALDPSSRIIKRERPENAFEIVLGTIGGVGLIMPFEHTVVSAAWTIHTYIFDRFLHTPRLLVHSRQSGCGKTALLSCVAGMARDSKYMIAPSSAVLYHQLRARPQTSFFIDDAEHSALWDSQSVLVQFIDSGHRQGGFIPRVVDKEVIDYPTFAPLTLGLILERIRRESFPQQVAERSIALEMKKSREGQDDVFPNDPRFVPVRAVISRFAETFRRPKIVTLPRGIFARRANNWHALVAIGDALGYGATLRAAAIATEAANFDPKIGLYEEILRMFEQWRLDRCWTSEITQALNEVDGGPWGSLTNSGLYDLLYPDDIGPVTVWKTGAGGRRSSNKGFYRRQFEQVWRELLGDTEAQSSKIIRLPRHKLGTGEAHRD